MGTVFHFVRSTKANSLYTLSVVAALLADTTEAAIMSESPSGPGMLRVVGDWAAARASMVERKS